VKSPELLQKIKTKRKHEASLLGHPGVVGVSVGLMRGGNGKRTKEAGIRVLVASTAAAPALPEKLEGVPVQVEVVGTVRADTLTRIRPLLGGTSLSKDGSTYFGTVGLVVADSQGSALALTNYHVIAGAVCAVSTSANVVQPAAFDGGTEIVGSVKGAFFSGGGAGISGVDAVVASVPPSIATAFGEIRELGSVTGYASAALGETVRKHGRTTETTYGVVTDISTTITVSFDFGSHQFFEQVSVTVTAPSSEVATSGDSGAVWINASGKAVGLHFASNGGHTIGYVNPMHAVVSRLGVNVVSPVTADPLRTFVAKGE
jgi:hypothetical protein